ncbi:MAG: response regulator [Planctomycetota bacterium]|jgi:two-component system chemotaxis response regulator CheY
MRVLVVDDSTTMRKLIARCLDSIGDEDLEILEAADGMHALAAISDETGGVDLILCDMNMPRVNGLSLLRSLRSTPEFRRIPFILVTGDVAGNSTEQALREGAADVIAKPFTMSKLGQAIRQWMPRSRGAKVIFETDRIAEKIRLVTGRKPGKAKGRSHGRRGPGTK